MIFPAWFNTLYAFDNSTIHRSSPWTTEMSRIGTVASRFLLTNIWHAREFLVGFARPWHRVLDPGTAGNPYTKTHTDHKRASIDEQSLLPSDQNRVSNAHADLSPRSDVSLHRVKRNKTRPKALCYFVESLALTHCPKCLSERRKYTYYTVHSTDTNHKFYAIFRAMTIWIVHARTFTSIERRFRTVTMYRLSIRQTSRLDFTVYFTIIHSEYLLKACQSVNTCVYTPRIFSRIHIFIETNICQNQLKERQDATRTIVRCELPVERYPHSA